MSATPIPGTIVWVDLQTPNLERARAFYGALLGWSYASGEDPSARHYTLAQLGGRNAAGLRKLAPAMPTLWTVYFATDDAELTAAQVSGRGGQIVTPAIDVMDAGRVAIFGDPTGAVFGVWQSLRLTGSEVFDEPGAMVWHDLYTRNAARACEFYAAIFELEKPRIASTTTAYFTLHKGDESAFGVMQSDLMPKSTPPHWNTYFAVRDLDSATRHLKQLGGDVFEPPLDTPHGRACAVADPFGAEFGLIQPEPGRRLGHQSQLNVGS